MNAQSKRISRLKATVICENSVAGPFGLIGEHGWALYVEADETNILFDTGQGLGILNNSVVLQKDLAEVRALVLSHGHYDHTSGLPAVLNVIGARPVFSHPDVFETRYWRKGGSCREIGIRYRKGYLESIGAQFEYVSRFEEIFPGIYLTGEVPRVTDFERLDPNLQVIKDGSWTQDEIKDDMSMVVDTCKGLVVVLGCAHSGLINILKHVKANMPGRPIHTVIGGTHLGFATRSQLEKTVSALDEFDIQKLGASHCTGLMNGAKLSCELGDKYFFASAGTTLEI